LTLIIKELAITTLQSKRINLWTTPIVENIVQKVKLIKSWFLHCFIS